VKSVKSKENVKKESGNENEMKEETSTTIACEKPGCHGSEAIRERILTVILLFSQITEKPVSLFNAVSEKCSSQYILFLLLLSRPC
jgi:hypothetical protein